MRLEPFRLERYFARYEFSAPYLLCSSDCESLSVGDLLELEPDARSRLSDLWLGYTESQGDPDLRREIAGLYERASADEVLVFSGAEEGIFTYMNVALSPGDHVIVHAPFYQSLAEVARAVGAEIDEWRGDPERDWALDLNDLKGLIQDRTRLVVVNFPHNPTGFLPTKELVEQLVALSEKHGFRIFADEVYRGLELDAADRLPALTDRGERAVSLGVMSKTYGLAGLRIGWLVTRDRELFQRLAQFKDYTTICNSGPSELLATLALRHRQDIVDRNLGIVRENLELLDRFFEGREALFYWYRPKAGSIAFPLLKEGSVDEMCLKLVESEGVMLLPGSLYEPGYSAFRIGFGRKNMPEALERFGRFLESWRP